MSNQYGNPNSTHSFGRASRTIVEKFLKIYNLKKLKINYLNEKNYKHNFTFDFLF